MIKQPQGLLMKYFVLTPLKQSPYGEASRRACYAYADAIDQENPQLANELREWMRSLVPGNPGDRR